MDKSAVQAIAANPVDEKNHLAKVRVAGSNPVVRSTSGPGQRLLLGGRVLLLRTAGRVLGAICSDSQFRALKQLPVRQGLRVRPRVHDHDPWLRVGR